MRALLLLLALAQPGWTRGPGTSAVPVFAFPLGARPSAMGGAYAALAEDYNATFWNPAGLAFVPQPAAAVTHASLYQGVNLDRAAVSAPLGQRAGVGAHFESVLSGAIERTVEDPGGSFDATASGGQFHDSELKFNAAAGGTPLDWLGVGAGLNYFRDSVDQNSADGVMLDVGALARMGIASYGISLMNAGPAVRGQDSLPTVLRLGAAVRPFDQLTAAAEFDHRYDSEQNVVALGAEYAFPKVFALRLGWRHTDSGGPGTGVTAGFGAAIGTFQLDYSFSPYGAIGSVHQIELSFRFGRERHRILAPSREALPLKKPEAAVGPEDHFMRADILAQAKNYGKAREELAAALALLAAEDRRRIHYFDRMGDIAMQEGDLDAAQTFFGDGLKLGASLGLSDPDVGDVYAGMGLCLAAKGNTGLGVRFLEKSLEFGPTPKRRSEVEEKLKELKPKRR